MKSPKPYTNEAFTKRVDHEAGRHRTRRASPGPKLCTGCGASYARGRWTLDGKTRMASMRMTTTAGATVCPACRMVAEGRFGGEVRLSGTYLVKHLPEVRTFVRNEVERASVDNPLARIVSWLEHADQLVVRTTTEHLAQRIGDALHHAFHGKVHYEFSHENKFAHVTWQRDL